MYTKTFKFQNKYYESNQGWGYYHPKHNYWYDPSCIDITNDIATLDISDNIYECKRFGAGQMVSKKHYTYGIFEWSYLLPKGRNIWPAIWLTGAKNWPPEIDVMEGWTSNNKIGCKSDNYLKFIGLNHIFPSIYIRKEDGSAQGFPLGSPVKRGTFSFLQPLNKINTCKLVWTPDVIEFYYNNKLINKVTDKEILKYFNEPMVVVMNNAITDKFKYADYVYYKKKGRPFKIVKFNYSYYEN